MPTTIPLTSRPVTPSGAPGGFVELKIHSPGCPSRERAGESRPTVLTVSAVPLPPSSLRSQQTWRLPCSPTSPVMKPACARSTDNVTWGTRLVVAELDWHQARRTPEPTLSPTVTVKKHHALMKHRDPPWASQGRTHLI